MRPHTIAPVEPLTAHQRNLLACEQARAELGPRPEFRVIELPYAPMSAAQLQRALANFDRMDACQAWDQAFAKRIKELTA